jgi:hypothetical protein
MSSRKTTALHPNSGTCPKKHAVGEIRSTTPVNPCFQFLDKLVDFIILAKTLANLQIILYVDTLLGLVLIFNTVFLASMVWEGGTCTLDSGHTQRFYEQPP